MSIRNRLKALERHGQADLVPPPIAIGWLESIGDGQHRLKVEGQADEILSDADLAEIRSEPRSAKPPTLIIHRVEDARVHR